MRVFILLAVVVAAVAADRVSYEGYQTWRIHMEYNKGPLVGRMIHDLNLDVWAENRKWMDVMVSPKQSRLVRERLDRINLKYDVHIQNVQEMITRDYEAHDKRAKDTRAINFEVYNTYEDIVAYLTETAANDDRATLRSLGQSYEGRELYQMIISVGAGKQPVWFDCGIHAREWITQATCVWGINHLLTNYGTNENVTALLDAYDVMIMPMNNPDGYVYSWTDDRMWRKNRNQYPEDQCVGIDLNRNFDDHFGGAGTSNISCSQTYTGPSPASEVETQATQAAITSVASTAKALFSIHAYSQLWMYPYGWTNTMLPAEADEMNTVSRIGVEALTSVNGTIYKYGPIATTIYPAAGTTVDYAYTAGIAHSYTLELRDTGNYGFLLPEDQIDITATETWAGLIAGVLAIP